MGHMALAMYLKGAWSGSHDPLSSKS